MIWLILAIVFTILALFLYNSANKLENTSYGIMCDWLSDIMKNERKKFVDIKEVKCPYCNSSDIKLGMFKNELECNSCKNRFGG